MKRIALHLLCVIAWAALGGCGQDRSPQPTAAAPSTEQHEFTANGGAAQRTPTKSAGVSIEERDSRPIEPRIGVKAQGSSQEPSGGSAPETDASAAWDEFLRSGRDFEGGPPPEPSGATPGASPPTYGAAAMPSAPQSSDEDYTEDSEPVDHAVVQVFYGTDRRPRSQPLVTNHAYIERFLPMALAAGLTALGIFLSPLLFKQRLSPTWTLLGIGASVVLGLSGIWSCWKLHLDYVMPRNDYGNGRGELTVGVCEVTVPLSHDPGELESPSLLRLEIRPDPSRHIVLQSVTPLDPDSFFDQMQSRVSGAPGKDVLVFVHGFDNSYEAAVRRTAQMAYDLKFKGAAVCYSWPSQGGLLKYFVDEANVESTIPNLQSFLRDIAAKSNAQRIHLIAHSMGNRALTGALRALANEVKEPLFNEVILTAPDVDAQVFRRDIVPAIGRTSHRTTLYASSNDRALWASRKIHGLPRAGDSGQALIVLPGLDTIDVSAVDTSLLGHSYYGSNESVLADIYDLIHTGEPPERRRWLQKTQSETEKLPHWIFGESTSLAQPDAPITR